MSDRDTLYCVNRPECNSSIYVGRDSLSDEQIEKHGWHNYAMIADDIGFICGRIKFVGAKHSAPFPSAVVIFREAQNEV